MSLQNPAGWGPTPLHLLHRGSRRADAEKPVRRSSHSDDHGAGWPGVGLLGPPIALLSVWASGLVLVLVAANLRPAITSMGAILPAIGMSPTFAAWIVAAPLACFAAGGLLAWPLHAWLGTGRTIVVALLTLAVAVATRVAAGPVLLLAGTVVACLAIAVLAVMLPIVARNAPEGRWAALTACHTTAMGAGSGIGALLTPQIATATSWRLAAASWSFLAVVACLAWLAGGPRITPHPLHRAPARSANPFRLTPRGTAWSVSFHLGAVCAVTFTFMGWLPQLLTDTGIPAETAKWLFIIAMALGVFIAPAVAKLAKRLRSQSLLALVLTLPTAAAVVWLLLAPARFPWGPAVLLGLGMLAVVLALGLIGLRSDPTTAAALSALVHGVGFAIAAVLSLAIGVLHSLTGAWPWSLVAALVVLLAQGLTGLWAGRPRTVRPATPRPA